MKPQNFVIKKDGEESITIRIIDIDSEYIGCSEVKTFEAPEQIKKEKIELLK